MERRETLRRKGIAHRQGDVVDLKHVVDFFGIRLVQNGGPEVADRFLGGLAQLRIVPPELQEGMRIQQQDHSMYSLKSFRGASKSGAM